MKPSDHLFNLVKSLSKSEKRYFKLFAQLQKGDKIYLSIIEHLEKAKTYNEEELKKELRSKGIQVNQIHVTKNYLQNLILKSLRLFHEGKTIDSKLNTLLLEAKILERKGFYEQYAKKLKTARKLSEKYELHLYTIEILDREILLNLGKRVKGLKEEIAELHAYKLKIIELQKIESDYEKLLHHVFVLYRTKNKAREKNNRDYVLGLLKNKLLEDASSARTFQSKISFFFTTALIHHIIGKELDKANAYYEKVIEIWDRYPFMKSERYKLYKIHLSNYLNSCHSIRKYDTFPIILERIKKIPVNSFDEEAEEFQNLSHLNLLYCLNTFQYEVAQALVPEIEQGIKKYGKKINSARELSLYGNIVILNFAMERYDEVLDWIERILSQNGNEHRTDIQTFAKVMRMIAHYELNNHFLLESLYRSVYRKLKKMNYLFDFENLVLQLIRKLQNSIGQEDRKEVLRNFYDQLKKIESDNIQKKIIGLQEISIWALGKIKNQSYIQTLREQQE